MKKIKEQEVKDGRAQKELEIMKCLEHRNIVKFIAGFVSHDPPAANLYMEWCDMGAVTNVIDAYLDHKVFVPEEFVFHVFQQLSAAVAYLHTGHDIHDDFEQYERLVAQRRTHHNSWEILLHNDIKPSNIFLTSSKRYAAYPRQYPRVLLGDFGVSNWNPDDARKGWMGGTLPYTAPEKDSTTSSDVWGLGASMQSLCRLNHDGALIARPAGVAEKKWFEDPKYKRGGGPGSEYSNKLKEIVALCQKRIPRERATAWTVAKRCKLHLAVKGGDRYFAPLPHWALPYATIETMEQYHEV
ncbi:MAG: hypothetical protein M1814_003246 [Vezdaea aestivalis]|nr:MAG: hypothetical protein M1814_003246 [Vezdaea aestivalis]